LRSGKLRDYKFLVKLVALSRVKLQEQVERVKGVAGGGAGVVCSGEAHRQVHCIEGFRGELQAYWSVG